MNALPHIGRTLPQRRDLRVLPGAASYAEHQRYTDETARWEMQRAERTELLPPEPAVFASGVACCAVEDDEATEVPLPVFLAICIASLGLWAAIGYATWWLVGVFTGVKA